MTALLSIALIFVCALAMMALEAFIPGVSIAGLAGVVLFILSSILCWRAYGAIFAILLLICGGALSFVIMRALFRSMRSGKLSKSGLVMNEQISPAVKVSSHEGTITPGSTGITRTVLHPAGIAEFETERIHVISENGFIEKDEPIVVSRVEGARIIVHKKES